MTIQQKENLLWFLPFFIVLLLNKAQFHKVLSTQESAILQCAIYWRQHYYDPYKFTLLSTEDSTFRVLSTENNIKLLCAIYWRQWVSQIAIYWRQHYYSSKFTLLSTEDSTNCIVLSTEDSANSQWHVLYRRPANIYCTLHNLQKTSIYIVLFKAYNN